MLPSLHLSFNTLEEIYASNRNFEVFAEKGHTYILSSWAILGGNAAAHDYFSTLHGQSFFRGPT